MKVKKNIIKKLFLQVLFISISLSSTAQVIEIEPLFEYPVAPEELLSLNEKSDYLVEHFWDSFDFKNKSTVDQNALNDAFRVYSTPLRFSSEEKGNASLDKLIANISKSPALLIQFTKAAEENLYGPRAEIWSDDIYLKFLNAVIKNKKIKPERKEKYVRQVSILENSKIGGAPPQFDFIDKDGKKKTYFPMATPTLLIFGDADDPDWRMARLKMETNSRLTQALEKGKLNILFMLPEKQEGWTNLVSNYSPLWTVGEAEGLKNIIDIRMIPSIYLIGSDGKISMKNAPLAEAIESALSMVE